MESKKMNLSEAVELGKLDEFIEQHKIDPRPDGRSRFERLLELMASGKIEDAETSGADSSADYDDTETPKDSSEDTA